MINDDIRFEERLRAKVDEYQVDLPDGDWDAIESRIGGHAAEPPRRGLWLRRVRYAAAAACAAALIGSVWFFATAPTDEQAVTALPTMAEMAATAGEGEDARHVVVSGEAETAGGGEQDTRRPASFTARSGALPADAERKTDVPVADEAARDEVVAAVTADEMPDGRQRRMRQEEAERLMRERDKELARMANAGDGRRRKAREVRRHRVSVGLLAASDPASPFQSSKPINQIILNENLHAVPVSPNIGEKRETHYLPVSVGADVSFEVYRNLDIRTGLTYTGLYSTFAQEFKNGSERTRSQRLHYIGMPLSVSYRFWNGKVLNTYASVGGMCEKGVANVSCDRFYDAETGETDESRNTRRIEGFQWSLSANVGLGVRLYRGLSFYLEPGFTWYIPNEVYPQPRSIRVKSPYNFSIKAGLRVQI